LVDCISAAREFVNQTGDSMSRGKSSDRNLTTTRTQVFGDVERGTECRICGRAVDDGRSKTCSKYCDRIQTAVMGMLNWNLVRKRILERDEYTCQKCGYDQRRDRRAEAHIQQRIEEQAGERPEHGVSMTNLDAIRNYDWDRHQDQMDEWRERREELGTRYGEAHCPERDLEVDHITRIADGGHPFDPGNLQTLCEHCHAEKTARENSTRVEGPDPETPSRKELNRQLFEFAADGRHNGGNRNAK